MLRLPIEEFRKPYCRTMAELMWNMRKEQSWPNQTPDMEGLNLAYKFFNCSSHLTLRLVGISELNTYINTFHDAYSSDHEPRLAAEMGIYFAQWILDQRIVEEIFGQNAHVELISRSTRIIEFLSQNQCLSLHHVDCIWNAAQMNYISRQVFEMLPNITRSLEPALLLHLYAKLREMDPASHTELTINVISAVIKAIWSHAVAQKPSALNVLQKRASANYSIHDKVWPAD